MEESKNKNFINKKNMIIAGIVSFAILVIVILILIFNGNKNLKDNGVFEEDDNIFRINPVKDPQLAYYNFRGEEYPDWSKFGRVRSNGLRVHQGVDIFAQPGTDVYAVLDGKVVDLYVDNKGYGLNLYFGSKSC